VQFVIGVLITYFILAPISFRFLGTYQVDETVRNYISLDSYISTFTGLTFTMGLVAQLPVVCWLLAKMGLLKAAFMRKYRRHALVLIMIAAAIITPPDVFTLVLVTLPLYLLYELCIFIVKRY
jgi:sec-independent protein translocase protein TatC